MKGLIIALITAYLLIGIGRIPAKASDLDDGISKYTDESISADDEMGKPDKNIKFIIENSKSQAKVAEKSTGGSNNTTTGSNSGDNNRNSVVMGAGSNVHGDIIIIDESKGNN